LTALKSIRSIQELEKYERGYFPCHTTVMREQVKLEKEMKNILGFSHKRNKRLNSEVASFDPEKLLCFIIKQYGLHEIALSESIEIAITADGASLGNSGIGHMTIGYKVVDKRAIIPNHVREQGKTNGFQSVNLCFPIRSVIGKETKDRFTKSFEDIYAFVTKISQIGFQGYKPITVVGPHDGKATIMVLARGGGAKITPQFCPYCVCSSEDLLNPCTKKCPDCIEINQNVCRHHAVTDHHEIIRIRNYLSSFNPEFSNLSVVPYFEQPNFLNELKEKDLLVTDTDHAQGSIITENPNHIKFAFESSTNATDKRIFLGIIRHQIRTRHKYGRLLRCDIRENSTSAVRSMVTQLEAEIAFENDIRMNRLILQIEDDTKEDRLLPVVSMIPDSMHMLNRTSERIIKILLLIGARQHMKPEGAILQSFQEEVEGIVNGITLDPDPAPTDDDDDDSWSSDFHVGKTWSFPKGEDSTELVGDVKMSFKAAKKFMDRIDLLYEKCFPVDYELRVVAIRAINMYREIMTTIQSHEDFSDADIINLSEKIRSFGDDWIAIAGLTGQTNYFHYLISGHVIHYLKIYRNYYRYCQQGWEALNSWIKTYFSHHSQRGGHGAKNQSYLLSIYRHFQRSYAWRTGVGAAFFEKNNRSCSEDVSEDVSSDVLESLGLLMEGEIEE